jgi:hypothetical protein
MAFMKTPRSKVLYHPSHMLSMNLDSQNKCDSWSPSSPSADRPQSAFRAIPIPMTNPLTGWVIVSIKVELRFLFESALYSVPSESLFSEVLLYEPVLSTKTFEGISAPSPASPDAPDWSLPLFFLFLFFFFGFFSGSSPSF